LRIEKGDRPSTHDSLVGSEREQTRRIQDLEGEAKRSKIETQMLSEKIAKNEFKHRKEIEKHEKVLRALAAQVSVGAPAYSLLAFCCGLLLALTAVRLGSPSVVASCACAAVRVLARFRCGFLCLRCCARLGSLSVAASRLH
jgi:hypothetical protein